MSRLILYFQRVIAKIQQSSRPAAGSPGWVKGGRKSAGEKTVFSLGFPGLFLRLESMCLWQKWGIQPLVMSCCLWNYSSVHSIGRERKNDVIQICNALKQIHKAGFQQFDKSGEVFDFQCCSYIQLSICKMSHYLGSNAFLSQLPLGLNKIPI